MLDCRVFLTAFALAVLTAVPAQARSCDAPGAEQLWSRSETRFVLVSDFHGTREIPAFLGEIVCAALRDGRSVTVALEWPDRLAPDLRRFYRARLSEASIRRLQGRVLSEVYDGRASAAMFDLVAELHRMKDEGARISVTPFVPSVRPRDENDYNAGMARSVRSIAERRPDDLVVVFAGNVHTMKGASPYLPGLTPMGMLLPPDETVSIDAADAAGEVWACQAGADGETVCGPQSAGTAPVRARGVRLTGKPGAAFDGIYNVGSALTASAPPAVSKRIHKLPLI